MKKNHYVTNKLNLILIVVLVFVSSTRAQDIYAIGTLLDSVYYQDSPIKSPLMRGDYKNLPSSVSLKKYAPTPKSQGTKGTCGGWATAYASRTILEAILQGIEGDEVNKISYSPSFVYNQLAGDKKCQKGISLSQALKLIQEKGSIFLSKFAYDCEKVVSISDSIEALDHRIIEFREIASSGVGNQVINIKKSLSEKKPVVIAFDTPLSFGKAKDLWIPDSADYKFWGRGHGMAVVGYDDEKYGGALEVINSWGTEWGNKGFSWIKYEDFEFFNRWGYELIAKSKPGNSVPNLMGSIKFTESDGSTIESRFNGNYFQFNKPFYSGSLLKIVFSNEQPAYVYAFSSDEETMKFEKIFPFSKNMVAYLPYSQNNVAIPNEDSYLMLDDIKGKTWFCFFYSSKSLDFDLMIKTLAQTGGTILERINKIFGEEMIDPSKIKYESTNEIKFSSFSEFGNLIPIIIEIEHK